MYKMWEGSDPRGRSKDPGEKMKRTAKTMAEIKRTSANLRKAAEEYANRDGGNLEAGQIFQRYDNHIVIYMSRKKETE